MEHHVAYLTTGGPIPDGVDAVFQVEDTEPVIRDSNRASLVAAARQHLCKVIDLGIAPYVEEETKKIFEDSFSEGIDILMTSGGVSMGYRDFIKPTLRRKGIVHFDKILMKPGKPWTFAEINSIDKNEIVTKILVVGLPGNPQPLTVDSRPEFHRALSNGRTITVQANLVLLLKARGSR